MDQPGKVANPARSQQLNREKSNIGKKLTVMLYTYINRHAGPPNKIKQKRGG